MDRFRQRSRNGALCFGFPEVRISRAACRQLSGVTILSVEPVGNYAVKPVFSDGHNTGIYSWETFLEYGRNQDEIWHAYLDKLDYEGKSR